MLQLEYDLLKEKIYIDNLFGDELDRFISEEKEKESTLLGKFKIGYALLKKNFIDEAYSYLSAFNQSSSFYDNILWYKKTFRNSDGTYSTYDMGDWDNPKPLPPDPGDGGWGECCCYGGMCFCIFCCGCIIGEECGCFEWSDCPQMCITCPCCCCSGCFPAK